MLKVRQRIISVKRTDLALIYLQSPDLRLRLVSRLQSILVSYCPYSIYYPLPPFMHGRAHIFRRPVSVAHRGERHML